MQCIETKRNETKRRNHRALSEITLLRKTGSISLLFARSTELYIYIYIEREREQTFSKSNNIVIFDKRNQYRNNGRRFMKRSRVKQFLFLNAETRKQSAR